MGWYTVKQITNPVRNKLTNKLGKHYISWDIHTQTVGCAVGWSYRIHHLLLCRRVRPPPLVECPGYDTKQSEGEVLVMLELWETRSISSLPSLPGPLLPGMVAPDRFLSMVQIQLNHVLMLNWIVWNRTVYMYKNCWFLTVTART